MKTKSLNMFVLIVLAATLSAMFSAANENYTLKIISLSLNVILIGFSILEIGVGNFVSTLFKPIVLICLLIICLNFIFSPYDPRYSLLIKYFGYFTIFTLGKKFAVTEKKLSCNTFLLYLLALLPLLIIGFFDKSIMKTTYFSNNNVFVYMGLCVSIFFILLKGTDLKSLFYSLCILSSYILVGTSLGILVAIFGAFFLLNIRKENFFMVSFFAICFILIILYSNMSVFVRIRDTISIYKALDWYDWTHLSELNFYELQQSVVTMGVREDNTSSLWRLLHWIELLKDYFTHPFHILFGLGADYSISKTSQAAHNDYIFLLTEYGLIIFYFIINGIVKIFKRLQSHKNFYLILAVIFYHFTENLIDTFPPNCLFYFTLGYTYFSQTKKKIIYENTFNK